MSETIEVVRPVWKPFIGVIYGFRLKESAEFRYVGLTTTSMRRRTQQHFKNAASGVKNPFYDWLRKHDEGEFFVQSFEVVTSYPADLGAAEQRWMEHFRAEGHRLLNLTEGGLGPTGYVWTDDQRKAAGNRARGRPTGISRKGPDSPTWGLRHTDEQKARWSEMRKGTNSGAANPNFGKFGAEHPSFGHQLSAETKARLSERKRGELNPNFGKVASAETRAKMSAVRKGRPMPSSARNAHTRYHTNKGVTKAGCKYCDEGVAQNLNESQTGMTHE